MLPVGLLKKVDRGPNFGVQMMNRANSEEESLKEEVSSLQAKIGGLEELIAELLLKNQQLRKALALTKNDPVVLD
jgi:predicted transcriptional regulator